MSEKRTKDKAALNEALDIAEIVRAIHERAPNGLKIMSSFKDKFNLEITDARVRKGSSRGTHYDFEILVNDVWKQIEHKGSKDLSIIKEDDTPWVAGVQFANMGCEKWSLAKKFAHIWYDLYIGSGNFKNEWNLSSSIPTFDEWFQNDCKVQDNPKTLFGIELKKNVRAKRGAKSSLLDKRAAVLSALECDTSEIETLKKEVHTIANIALKEKDYWIVIRGDLKGEFNVAWYPKFTIDTINEVILTKENDLKLEFRCDNNFRFNGILRWGKGAGFSNLRLDLK